MATEIHKVAINIAIEKGGYVPSSSGSTANPPTGSGVTPSTGGPSSSGQSGTGSSSQQSGSSTRR
jgi:hypothetical protein